MAKTLRACLGERIDADDLAASFRRGLQRREHAGMIGAGVLADDEDGVRQLKVLERARSPCRRR